jgi:hypothetical protein
MFSDLKWWNNEAALVKHGGMWRIYNIAENRFTGEAFSSFGYLRNDRDEVLLKTYRSTGYGILSSRHGRVLDEQYSQIRNVGTDAVPFYLTEIHVPAAKFHFFAYFDTVGQIITEQSVKGNAYKRLVCEEM